MLHIIRVSCIVSWQLISLLQQGPRRVGQSVAHNDITRTSPVMHIHAVLGVEVTVTVIVTITTRIIAMTVAMQHILCGMQVRRPSRLDVTDIRKNIISISIQVGLVLTWVGTATVRICELLRLPSLLLLLLLLLLRMAKHSVLPNIIYVGTVRTVA